MVFLAWKTGFSLWKSQKSVRKSPKTLGKSEKTLGKKWFSQRENQIIQGKTQIRTGKNQFPTPRKTRFRAGETTFQASVWFLELVWSLVFGAWDFAWGFHSIVPTSFGFDVALEIYEGHGINFDGLRGGGSLGMRQLSRRGV